MGATSNQDSLAVSSLSAFFSDEVLSTLPIPYLRIETVHTPFGVEDLLRACEEGMVSTPHIDIDFRLSGAGGHHNFAVANEPSRLDTRWG